jgi:hypothetical protein
MIYLRSFAGLYSYPPSVFYRPVKRGKEMPSPTKITWARRNARDAKLVTKRNKKANKVSATKKKSATK